ncbi:DNA-binding transcriptional regulator, GntR family [Nocardioides exalbidus]|uniref:DNA-binding transcriptional regulator, GntR family n=1 Tax=Nocardioides exalbidus TaxID=402596 RepID=A0A1H4U6C9_9ACTN|nr:GntR family transcriptional regulator [Nocardioides exalbidus]SEC64275.1 DNA-binding transcriptional regulator, GntR family [Nocardioides exalbidus]
MSQPVTPDPSQDGRFASGKVVEHLRGLILSGALAPGARIRQEEVAAELGSSRLPVREALQILRHQGLVRLKPNSGASVMPFDPAECDLIYRVREQVEPIVLAESVPHLTDQQVAELGDLQQQIAGTRDVEEFLDLDRRFHLLTYAGCPMESMLEMVERFWDTTQHYRRLYTRLLGDEGEADDAGWWIADAEHRLMLAAIREGDGAQAGHLLAGHVQRSRIRLADSSLER